MVTLGNTPNTDVLCSSSDGTKFVHIQVKTFVPGNKTCSVGLKAERDFGPNFFWVLAGIPTPGMGADFQYFVIPSKDMAVNVSAFHKEWLRTPGKNDRPHQDSSVRAVNIPPSSRSYLWSIESYLNKWEYIIEKLAG